MIKVYLSVLLITWLGINMGYANDIYKGKSDQELLNEFLKNPKFGYNPLDVKYVYTELYVGMPEQDFLHLYKWKNEIKEGELKPYLVEHKKNQYYLGFVYADTKDRVTFKDGKLIKYEIIIREKPPFAFLVYSNHNYLLKGHEMVDGLYRWMSEEEFLKDNQDKIIEKIREGFYCVKLSGERYYTVSFDNGYLYDVSKQDPRWIKKND